MDSSPRGMEKVLRQSRLVLEPPMPYYFYRGNFPYIRIRGWNVYPTDPQNSLVPAVPMKVVWAASPFP